MPDGKDKQPSLYDLTGIPGTTGSPAQPLPIPHVDTWDEKVAKAKEQQAAIADGGREVNPYPTLTAPAPTLPEGDFTQAATQERAGEAWQQILNHGIRYYSNLEQQARTYYGGLPASEADVKAYMNELHDSNVQKVRAREQANAEKFMSVYGDAHYRNSVLGADEYKGLVSKIGAIQGPKAHNFWTGQETAAGYDDKSTDPSRVDVSEALDADGNVKVDFMRKLHDAAVQRRLSGDEEGSTNQMMRQMFRDYMQGKETEWADPNRMSIGQADERAYLDSIHENILQYPAYYAERMKNGLHSGLHSTGNFLTNVVGGGITEGLDALTGQSHDDPAQQYVQAMRDFERTNGTSETASNESKNWYNLDHVLSGGAHMFGEFAPSLSAGGEGGFSALEGALARVGVEGGLKGAAARFVANGVGDTFTGRLLQNSVHMMKTAFPQVYSGYVEDGMAKGYTADQAMARAFPRALWNTLALSVPGSVARMGIRPGALPGKILSTAVDQSAMQRVMGGAAQFMKAPVVGGASFAAGSLVDSYQNWLEDKREGRNGVDANTGFLDYMNYEQAKKEGSVPHNMSYGDYAATPEAQKFGYGHAFKDMAEQGMFGVLWGVAEKAIHGHGVLPSPVQADYIHLAANDVEKFSQSVDKNVSRGTIGENEGTSLKAFIKRVAPTIKEGEAQGLPARSAAQYAVEAERLKETAGRITALENMGKPGEKITAGGKKRPILLGPDGSGNYTEQGGYELQAKIGDLRMKAAKSEQAIRQLMDGTYMKDRAVGGQEMMETSAKASPGDGLRTGQARKIISSGPYQVSDHDISGYESDPEVRKYMAQLAAPVHPTEGNEGSDAPSPEVGESVPFKPMHSNPIVLDEHGNIIDGKKRVAYNLVNGIKEMQAARPIPMEDISKGLRDEVQQALSAAKNEGEDLKPQRQGQFKAAKAVFDAEMTRDRKPTKAEKDAGITTKEARAFYVAANSLHEAGVPRDEALQLLQRLSGDGISQPMAEAVYNHLDKTKAAGKDIPVQKPGKTKPTAAKPVPDANTPDPYMSQHPKWDAANNRMQDGYGFGDEHWPEVEKFIEDKKAKAAAKDEKKRTEKANPQATAAADEAGGTKSSNIASDESAQSTPGADAQSEGPAGAAAGEGPGGSQTPGGAGRQGELGSTEGQGLPGILPQISEVRKGRLVIQDGIQPTIEKAGWTRTKLEAFHEAVKYAFKTSTKEAPFTFVVVDNKGMAEYGRQIGQDFSDPMTAPEAGVSEDRQTIYFNVERASPDVAFHELGHVWDAWAEAKAPQLFELGERLAEASPEYKYTMAYIAGEEPAVPAGVSEKFAERLRAYATAYMDYPDPGKAIRSEIRAHAIQAHAKGMSKIESLGIPVFDKETGEPVVDEKTGEQKTQKGTWGKWLDSLWNGIAEAMGLRKIGFADYTTKDIANMTLDKFTRAVTEELASGKTLSRHIKDAAAEAKNVRDKGKTKQDKAAEAIDESIAETAASSSRKKAKPLVSEDGAAGSAETSPEFQAMADAVRKISPNQLLAMAEAKDPALTSYLLDAVKKTSHYERLADVPEDQRPSAALMDIIADPGLLTTDEDVALMGGFTKTSNKQVKPKFGGRIAEVYQVISDAMEREAGYSMPPEKIAELMMKADRERREAMGLSWETVGKKGKLVQAKKAGPDITVAQPTPNSTGIAEADAALDNLFDLVSQLGAPLHALPAAAPQAPAADPELKTKLTMAALKVIEIFTDKGVTSFDDLLARAHEKLGDKLDAVFPYLKAQYVAHSMNAPEAVQRKMDKYDKVTTFDYANFKTKRNATKQSGSAAGQSEGATQGDVSSVPGGQPRNGETQAGATAGDRTGRGPSVGPAAGGQAAEVQGDAEKPSGADGLSPANGAVHGTAAEQHPASPDGRVRGEGTALAGPLPGVRDKVTPAKEAVLGKGKTARKVTYVGDNSEGEHIYADENGVRSKTANGNIFDTEPVSLRPTDAGVETSVGDVPHEFRTVEELAGGGPVTRIKVEQVEKAERPASSTPTPQNFVFDPAYTGEKTFNRNQRTKDNIAALEVLNKLESEQRMATPEEQAVLAKYVGWGGIKTIVLDPDNDAHWTVESDVKLRDGIRRAQELIHSLDPDGSKGYLHQAQRSVENAHYTSVPVIRGIYDALKLAGFNGGRVLEPSAGIGNFLAGMPGDMAAGSLHTAVELDPITGRILQQLQQRADVHIMGFEEAGVKNDTYDLAIGNVPFDNDLKIDDAALTRRDKRYREEGAQRIHNYFFLKALDKVRPGGVVAFITTTGTLDSPTNRVARELMGERAEILGALRLPGTTFQDNAGTEVVTDLIFLRKLNEGEAPPESNNRFLDIKKQTVMDGMRAVDVSYNNYYHEHPENLLGKVVVGGLRPGQQDSFYLEGDRKTDMQKAIAKAAKGIFKTPFYAEAQQRHNEELAAKALHSVSEGEFERIGNLVELPDGSIGRVNGDYFINPELDKKAIAAGVDPEKIRDGRLTWGDKQLLKEAGINEADFFRRSVDVMRIGKDRRPIVQKFIGLRKLFNGLTAAEHAGMDDRVVEPMRAELRRQYEDFVKKHGLLSDNTKAILDDNTRDADAYGVIGLERKVKKDELDARGREQYEYVPSDILYKRTVSPVKKITEASTVPDAIIASLQEFGRVNIDHIATLLGRSAGEIMAEQRAMEQPLLYEHVDGSIEGADRYLSGNVRKKLLEVQMAAEKEPEKYAANIRNLEQVQPADVPAGDIYAPMGANWIPLEYIRDFIKDHLGFPLKVSYNRADKKWEVEGTKQTTPTSESYGTKRRKLDWILERALNGISPTVTYTVEVSPGHTKTVVDEEDTAMAGENVKRFQRAWDDWKYTDDERRQRMQRIYNDLNNNIRLWEPHGDHMTFPGMVFSGNFKEMRKHQKDVVWRMLQTVGGVMDHMVGAGKTLAMAAMAMEGRRTGLFQKPMFIGLKAQVKQGYEEFKKAYPNASILYPTAKDFEAKNRKQLLSRIATNDWDIVMLTHDQFNMLRQDEEIQGDIHREMLAELESAKAGAKDKDALRRINERIDKVKAKIKELTDVAKDRDVKGFHELGVDYLMVDESQEFKNLEFATNHSNVRGLGNPAGSKRAFNLLIAARTLQKKWGDDKGVLFASGTPISNSISEMYTLFRYLRPNMLREQGIDSLDSWLKVFAEHDTQLEYTMGKHKDVTRLRRFVNLPELVTQYRDLADVRNKLNLELPRPKANHHLISVKPTQPQNQLMKKLMAFVESKGKDYREELGMTKGFDHDKDKNPTFALMATQFAKVLSMDPRLIRRHMGEGSKIKAAADNIYNIYHQTDRDRGTQLVFSDVGTPKGKNPVVNLYNHLLEAGSLTDAEMDDIFGEDFENQASKRPLGKVREKVFEVFGQQGLEHHEIQDIINDSQNGDTFDVYNELKNQLMAKGIPENEIAFIHDYDGDKKRAELYKAVNNGEIRVLVGSTKKLGTGVNVQRLAIAGHHMDIPWRPSDLEQRTGRVERQGNELAEKLFGTPDNKWGEVDMFYYATERLMDASMYELVKTKGDFIDQVKTGGANGQRDMADLSEDPQLGDWAGELSGDPLMKRSTQLKKEVKELDLSARAHMNNQHRLRDQIRNTEKIISATQEELPRLQAALETYRSLPKEEIKDKDGNVTGHAEDVKFSATIGGEHFDQVTKAGQKILDLFEANKRDARIDLGSLYGVYKLEARISRSEYKNDVTHDMKIDVLTPHGDVIGTVEGIKDFSEDTLSAAQVGTRLNGQIRKLEEKVSLKEDIIQRQEKNLAQYQSQIADKFPQEERLSAAREELRDVELKIRDAVKKSDEEAKRRRDLGLGEDDEEGDDNTDGEGGGKGLFHIPQAAVDNVRALLDTGKDNGRFAAVAMDELQQKADAGDGEAAKARGDLFFLPLSSKGRAKAIVDAHDEYYKRDDEWMANKDEAFVHSQVTARNFQEEIQRSIGPRPHWLLKNAAWKEWKQQWRDMDRAMHIYLDTRRNPAHLNDYNLALADAERTLASHSGTAKEMQDARNIVAQKKTVELSQHLTPEQKDIADRIGKEYEDIGKMAKDAGLIKDVLDNYVARAWNIGGGYTDLVGNKFRTSSRHQMQRTLDTILEGFAKGYTLKIEGATNNLATLSREISNVIENRSLLEDGLQMRDDEDLPLFSTHKLEGYEPIESSTFQKWGYDGTLSDYDAPQRQLIGKSKDMLVTETGAVIRKRQVYAPADIAKHLNNVLGRTTLDGAAVQGLTLFNRAVKESILSFSGFHYIAFTRAHMLSAGKVLPVNPRTAYKTGLKLLAAEEPLLMHVVRNGLTLNRRQDFDEGVIAHNTWLGEKLDNMGFLPAQRKSLQEFNRAMHKHLFETYGAGLKAFDAVNLMKQEIGRNTGETVDEIGKRVAKFMNDTYGGLNWNRMRGSQLQNPTTRHLYSLLMLAPDWTISNIRLAKKAFAAGREGDLYRRMWGKVIMRGVALTALMNAALAFGDETDDEGKPISWVDAMERRFKKGWDAGHLRWTMVDITPLYHAIGGDKNRRSYFSIFGAYTDVVKMFGINKTKDGQIEFGLQEFLQHKGSFTTKALTEFFTGEDWQHKQFTTLDEMMGLDDKGAYRYTAKAHHKGDVSPYTGKPYTNEQHGHEAGAKKGGKHKGDLVRWPDFGGSVSVLKRPATLPSFLGAELRGMLPTSLQALAAASTGENDWAQFALQAPGTGIVTSKDQPVK